MPVTPQQLAQEAFAYLRTKSQRDREVALAASARNARLHRARAEKSLLKHIKADGNALLYGWLENVDITQAFHVFAPKCCADEVAVERLEKTPEYMWFLPGEDESSKETAGNNERYKARAKAMLDKGAKRVVRPVNLGNYHWVLAVYEKNASGGVDVDVQDVGSEGYCGDYVIARAMELTGELKDHFGRPYMEQLVWGESGQMLLAQSSRGALIRKQQTAWLLRQYETVHKQYYPEAVEVEPGVLEGAPVVDEDGETKDEPDVDNALNAAVFNTWCEQHPELVISAEAKQAFLQLCDQEDTHFLKSFSSQPDMITGLFAKFQGRDVRLPAAHSSSSSSLFKCQPDMAQLKGWMQQQNSTDIETWVKKQADLFVQLAKQVVSGVPEAAASKVHEPQGGAEKQAVVPDEQKTMGTRYEQAQRLIDEDADLSQEDLDPVVKQMAEDRMLALRLASAEYEEEDEITAFRM